MIMTTCLQQCKVITEIKPNNIFNYTRNLSF